MIDDKLFENLRYVVDHEGKKAAVLVDVQAWETLLDYIEDSVANHLCNQRR